MTNAEITAYNAGRDVAGMAPLISDQGVVAAVIPDVEVTPEVRAARVRLGDQAFFYWVLRGAVEADQDQASYER